MSPAASAGAAGMRGADDDERRRIGAWVIVLCLGQLLLWSGAFALGYRAPEMDSAEQFVWAFSLENGYWKHPPVPSWIMHALLRVFGPSVALPFFAAQACVVIALALTWRLGCEFMSPRRSLAALLLGSLVAYHNLGADSFNHNVALLPFQAATVLLFHRATRGGTALAWVAAGLFAALAMLVKYVAVLPFAGLLLYVAIEPRLHDRRVALGLLLAAGVAALAMLPHLLWLRDSDFLPFRYARSVAQVAPDMASRLRSLADFLAIQFARLLPMAAGLWFAWRHRRAAAPAADARFLWVAGLAPLLLIVLVNQIGGTELQSRWGANAFLLAGWLAVAALRIDVPPQRLRRLIAFVAALHLALALSMTWSKAVLADRLHIHTRANFPGDVLAQHAHETWSQHSAQPLRLVVSDIWLGGNVVAHSDGRVAVLIDGHHFKSPWVRDEAVAGCGALVLDDLTRDEAGHGEARVALDTLMARASFTGIWDLPWAHPGPDGDRSPSGRVRWGVLLPQPGERCPL